MLVCNVSLRPARAGIAAEITETTEATDATATGQVVFATLVDDPASVGDTVDAYLGEIMLEAASAADTPDGGFAYAAAVVEAASAADTPDAVFVYTVAETATATDTPAATITAGTSAEVSQFLTRTSGLDTTHVNAYTALIDGLVADGVWAKLDMLHVYATQDSTTALLNLVSTSYTGTLGAGPPTFTTDRGFNSVNNSIATYIITNFNPATATSPKFVQNSAHISVWNAAITGNSSNASMGATGTNTGTMIIPQLTNSNTYYRANSGNLFYTSTGTQGHFIANRSTSSAIQGYKNGTSAVTDNASTSTAIENQNIFVLAANSASSAPGGNIQAAMASIGSSLSSTDVTNFYNRLRTYMTVVGVP